MMTAESMLSKRPVSRIAVASFFPHKNGGDCLNEVKQRCIAMSSREMLRDYQAITKSNLHYIRDIIRPTSQRVTSSRAHISEWLH